MNAYNLQLLMIMIYDDKDENGIHYVINIKTRCTMTSGNYLIQLFNEMYRVKSLQHNDFQ